LNVSVWTSGYYEYQDQPPLVAPVGTVSAYINSLTR